MHFSKNLSIALISAIAASFYVEVSAQTIFYPPSRPPVARKIQREVSLDEKRSPSGVDLRDSERVLLQDNKNEEIKENVNESIGTPAFFTDRIRNLLGSIDSMASAFSNNEQSDSDLKM